MDRRAARTRKALHIALMSLVQRKRYEAITVQDILDEADVGRSTFYAHYTGKEDLLRRGFEVLRAELEEARRAVRRHGSQEGILGFSLAMFEHAGKYADTYRALIGSHGHAIVISEIRQVLLEMARKEVSAARKAGNVPEELTLQFIVGTFLTVLTWWLERKPKLATTQIQAMFRELILGGIGSAILPRVSS